MKKLKQSTAAKLIAAILLIVFAATALCSVICAYVFEDIGVYYTSRNNALSKLVSGIGNKRTSNAFNQWLNSDGATEDIYPGSGFVFCVRDKDGNIIYDGLQGRAYTWHSGERVYLYSPPVEVIAAATQAVEQEYASVESSGSVIVSYIAPAQSPAPESAQEPDTYYFVGYLLAEPPEADRELLLVYGAFSFMYEYKNDLVYAACGCAFLSLALYAFLLAAAGHRRDGSVRGGVLCRVPFDLLTFVCMLAIVALAALFINAISSRSMLGLCLIVCVLSFILAGVIFIVWSMCGAVHIKNRRLLKSCICWRFGGWCLSIGKKSFRLVREFIRGLPLIPKSGVVILGVLLLEFLWMMAVDADDGVLLGWLLERAILVVLTLYTLLCMKKLLIGGRAIADGDLSYQIDDAKMYGPLKEHAEDLNNITAGLNSAVSERMKSERFRTELITNVSHDIKTPLTSIINYVDLLEKERPENEKMREYLEVLARQSARLKKLIEDLIEASKASTGSLSVNPEICILSVLIDQTVGEYAERLSAKRLELIVSKPDDSLSVMADGRHMWRIFDNLMNNICKYAQSGTRVYLDVSRRGERAVVTFRNISENRLSFSGDELAMRFVRGDAARSTEGSGLGLSIAQSLAKLQGGDMKLTVDGDLFKVELDFPCA